MLHIDLDGVDLEATDLDGVGEEALGDDIEADVAHIHQARGLVSFGVGDIQSGEGATPGHETDVGGVEGRIDVEGIGCAFLDSDLRKRIDHEVDDQHGDDHEHDDSGDDPLDFPHCGSPAAWR